jgi:hypothetical protein
MRITLPPLVTLETAKLQLRITGTDYDTDVELRRVQATNIILDFLQDRADASWTDTTVPDPVQQAVLVMLTHLYERGANTTPAAGGTPTDADVWKAIERLLARSYDPGLV